MDHAAIKHGGSRRALRTAAALLLSVAAAWGGAADTPAPRTLVVFGDSLTAGLGLSDPATQSYPARIQGKFDAGHLPWRVVNAGLSGETSAGGLRRVDWVLNQRTDMFLLELGGNDGLRGIPPSVTEANLQSIIDRVHSKYPGATIVLAGMRMPPNMGQDYTEAFAAVFPELARRNRIALVPFLLEGVAERPDRNQADGIHPNPTGAAVVADVVWKVISPLLAAGK